MANAYTESIAQGPLQYVNRYPADQISQQVSQNGSQPGASCAIDAIAIEWRTIVVPAGGLADAKIQATKPFNRIIFATASGSAHIPAWISTFPTGKIPVPSTDAEILGVPLYDAFSANHPNEIRFRQPVTKLFISFPSAAGGGHCTFALTCDLDLEGY